MLKLTMAKHRNLQCETQQISVYFTKSRLVAVSLPLPLQRGNLVSNLQSVEQWDIFELSLNGPTEGNPFLDVQLVAQFAQGDRKIEVRGFYDGNGVYRVRFMPDTVGKWRYTTQSNALALDATQGIFECVASAEDNHGPVRVVNTYHFAYADGTPYFPFGTTCYAWTHQGDELEEQTLATLQETAFNKIRMCVFPKHYPFNANEPVYYPYERNTAGENDFTRFDPAFFRHFEQRLAQLRDLGIEADIILWHPYDHWGYAQMDEDSDYRYLRYLVARLSAYRNVWWSLANEYDFMLAYKPMERWDRFFEILQEEDPYQHLRSIHNGNPQNMYDHTNPSVTHVCIQHSDIKQVVEWRKTFGKPIVNDELEYEGNILYPWGGISAEEETHRFWIMVANGGYAGHGETYMHPEDILWWAKGGVLQGESWKRIGFLREIIEDAPAGGLSPQRGSDEHIFGNHGMSSYFPQRYSAGKSGDYYLVYLENYQPKLVPFWLPEGKYEFDIIDSWKMTILPAKVNILSGPESYLYDFLNDNPPTHVIELPGKPRMAIRIQKKTETH